MPLDRTFQSKTVYLLTRISPHSNQHWLIIQAGETSTDILARAKMAKLICSQALITQGRLCVGQAKTVANPAQPIVAHLVRHAAGFCQLERTTE